ncbi:hypothetical protein BD309DRAFT_956518 [Dichomitus squalens]|uniref:Uncharacterized protein n=1 Tax=Dichomitus squalens TaxID=114155 RepID=A0A4Q9NU78_9APHY|nr:hypothetical protein BD311DRAFT_719312 [Dichomitus squalens]TBU45254.1 hypothetical protein BD309DRAFT_956518 [Dichomitus squalens]TBU61430.1 hypothetical protein BD310DRAFT_873429 [Dichomitus squalens]
MAESAMLSALPTPDHKRRKSEAEAGHVKAERAKGVAADKAKANYLSGQLRLRLQYAKLKVEHGWQRQTLSEVENLYFRHTHLTRPYPVISPGGRRNGRTLSSNSFSTAATQQENVPSTSTSQNGNGSVPSPSVPASAGSNVAPRLNGTLSGTSSSLSADPSITLSVPSTPTAHTNRTTPLAPHVGFGNSMTRYPISRSDSTATVIMESTPSLYPASHAIPNARRNTGHAPMPSQLSAASSSSTLQATPSSQTLASNNSFHEPFDPMQPTEHVDSQLAALRSMITASSSHPIPLPAPSSGTPTGSPMPPTAGSPGVGGGLTYDAFWSAHGTATSYRTLLAGHGQPTRPSSAAPLQAHASAPAIMASQSANGGSVVGDATPR